MKSFTELLAYDDGFGMQTNPTPTREGCGPGPECDFGLICCGFLCGACGTPGCPRC